ncbi:MAG: hypothetical protein KQI35_07460 [Bacteroidetes bacterium]|nr:hypothetical protein [Bacteroidota bacterium]
MNKKHLYLLVGLMAVLIRFFLNYHAELIPGLNGGYYPVQIRALLNDGILAFPDMPLLFHVQALLTKIITLIAPGIDSEELILHVSKIIDSVALPMILFPAYLISRDFVAGRLPWIYETGIIGFLTLSYSPLLLSSDFQKNAFTLPLLLLFFYYFLIFLRDRNKSSMARALLLLFLMGLTHFGVFSLCLAILSIGFLIFDRQKALLPMVIILTLSLALIAFMDISRAERLLFFWWRDKTFQISPRIWLYPHGIITYTITLSIIVLTGITLYRQKSCINDFHKKILIMLVAILLLMSYPFLRFEFGRRLGLMHFIPQSLLLLFIYPYLKPKFSAFLSYFAILMFTGSVFFHVLYPKPIAINHEAYRDLKRIDEVIEDKSNTLIITRHGLDWWIAWQLKTKIAIAYLVEVDEALMEKYDTILIIKQKKGRNKDYPGGVSPFTEPKVPEGSELIYSSDYFDLFKLMD